MFFIELTRHLHKTMVVVDEGSFEALRCGVASFTSQLSQHASAAERHSDEIGRGPGVGLAVGVVGVPGLVRFSAVELGLFSEYGSKVSGRIE